MTLKIGWFTTARDKAALDLFNAVYDAIGQGIIKGEISFVFSNRGENESAQSDRFFQMISDLKIPLICFSSQQFRPELRLAGKRDENKLKSWRLQYDREIIAKIEQYDFDIIVLAGYMLIVGAEICKRFKMINLHPALPGGPTGTWQEVIWKLIEEKQTKAGAMMHLVTEELDKGPPITYYSFPIQGGEFDPLWQDLEMMLGKRSLLQTIQKDGEKNPLFALIRAEGARREIPLIVYTIAQFASGKIRTKNGGLVTNGKVGKDGYCLNKEIEEYLKRDTRFAIQNK